MIDFSDDMNKICNLPLKERHSYFQLQYFLIGKEPTLQSKMWRCVQELKSRKDSLLAMEMEIEDSHDDIKILDIELENLQKSEKNEIAKIKIRKIERNKKAKELKIIGLQEKQKTLEEECVFLVKAFKSLNQKEELKAFDDLDAQKEFWNEKLSQEFNLRNRFNMPPDMELIKTILALNSDAIVKQDLLQTLNTKATIESSELTALMEKAKFSHKQDDLVKSILERKNDI